MCELEELQPNVPSWLFSMYLTISSTVILETANGSMFADAVLILATSASRLSSTALSFMFPVLVSWLSDTEMFVEMYLHFRFAVTRILIV